MEGGAVLRLLSLAAPTEELDPNSVTPGVIGFVLTIIVAAAVLLLVVDMSRRIRRVNYRQQAIERLDAEEAAERDADGGAAKG